MQLRSRTPVARRLFRDGTLYYVVIVVILLITTVGAAHTRVSFTLFGVARGGNLTSGYGVVAHSSPRIRLPHSEYQRRVFQTFPISPQLVIRTETSVHSNRT